MKFTFVVLNFLLIENGGGLMYRKIKDMIPTTGTKIISKQNEPSLLSCAQHCAFRKAEFVYNVPLCTCLVYLDDNEGEKSDSNKKMISNSFYKVWYTGCPKKRTPKSIACEKITKNIYELPCRLEVPRLIYFSGKIFFINNDRHNDNYIIINFCQK